ncbi:unnamed protein product [Caenorhabditis angaria]|uniref:Serpentine receptor class r-10 n=1 Tax=Caenorhabditis angaria TaxID=860376 RepID=A0A9P1N450_9PELO|nr:unnamed protein product [Caenorhabditis angaria]
MSTVFQTTASIISILFNVLLLTLIVHKSPKKLGSYKYLMIFFTSHSIFLSTLEIIVKPYVLSHGTSFIVFMNRTNSIFPYEVDLVILCMGCACCGITMYISAIHFIYRYWAIERKGRLEYFKGFRVIFWFTIPLSMGTLWGFATFFGLKVDESTMQYIRTSMTETYGFHTEHLVMVGAFYYSPNKMNFYRNLGGAMVLALIMTSSAAIIIYCGIRVFRKIRKIHQQGSARFTKRLQTQLYKALVVQTALPVILLYFPLGLFFFLPLIQVDIGTYSQIANLTLAIYPALEPLPLLIIIDNYRRGLFEFFSRKVAAKNQVQPVAEQELRTNSLSFGTSFVVVMDRRGSWFSYDLDMIFLVTACGFCGVTMSICAINFIYRYWAIERKGRLKRFQGYRLIFWLLIPISSGILWGFAVHFGLHIDQIALDYVSPHIAETYGLDANLIAIVGAYYFSPNRIMFYRNLGALGILSVILMSLLTIILYCGVRIFRKIRKIHRKGSSKVTKLLQAQLYKALVVQAFFPVFLLFIPISLFVFLPFIKIDIGIYSHVMDYTIAIYPLFEPLPSLIIIDDYRKSLWNIVKPSFTKPNQIQPEIPTASLELQNRS